MKNTKKQAFTLVELIVVITILAILGTIAFISLQGYSQDAKNSKVTSDIASIAKKITLRTTDVRDSTTLPKLLSGSTANAMTGVTVASWSTLTKWDWYDAWTINFAELQESPDKFKDPEGNSYIFAYAIVNDKNFVTYQVAWQIKNADDTYKAKIAWNYYKKDDGDANWLIAASGSNTAVTHNSPLGTAGLY